MEQSKTTDASGGEIAEWLAEQEAAARGRANDQRPASSSEHWHRAQAAAYEAAHAYAVVRPLATVSSSASTAEREGFTCAARRQGSAGGNDPADCNWPVCGCDPHADKVIAALQESGLLASAPPAPTPEAGSDPLVAYLDRQWAWSKETFGPALRTRGIVQHITKELREIEAEPHDLAEWVDVIILAMDGFWRHGGKPADLLPAMQAKQDRNFARTWPDWRTMGEDQAIEHDRSGEAPPPAEDLAGQGEPVAWAYEYRENGRWREVVIQTDPRSALNPNYTRNIRPLYAAPAPSRPADREEIARAFEEAALARDEAGYLGTPADCIRALAEENAALRDAPRDGGDGIPAGWTATPLDPLGVNWRLTKDAPTHPDCEGKGGER